MTAVPKAPQMAKGRPPRCLRREEGRYGQNVRLTREVDSCGRRPASSVATGRGCCEWSRRSPCALSRSGRRASRSGVTMRSAPRRGGCTTRGTTGTPDPFSRAASCSRTATSRAPWWLLSPSAPRRSPALSASRGKLLLGGGVLRSPSTWRVR